MPSDEAKHTRGAVGEAGEQYDVTLLQLLSNGVPLQEPHAACRLHAHAALVNTLAIAWVDCLFAEYAAMTIMQVNTADRPHHCRMLLHAPIATATTRLADWFAALRRAKANSSRGRNHLEVDAINNAAPLARHVVAAHHLHMQLLRV